MDTAVAVSEETVETGDSVPVPSNSSSNKSSTGCKSRFELICVLTDCSQGIVYTAYDRTKPLQQPSDGTSLQVESTSVDSDYFKILSRTTPPPLPPFTAHNEYSQVVVKKIVKQLVKTGNINKYGKVIYENIEQECNVLQYISRLQKMYHTRMQIKYGMKSNQKLNVISVDNTTVVEEVDDDGKEEAEKVSVILDENDENDLFAYQNIVQYIGHWIDDNFFYLVLEKYSGGDLFKLMKNMHEIVPNNASLVVRPKKKTETKKSINNINAPAGIKRERSPSETKMIFSCMHLYRQSSYLESEQRPLLNHEKTEWIEKIQILFKQMCLAVNFLHTNGVCHLDISLENFMIDYYSGAENMRYGTPSANESPSSSNNNSNFLQLIDDRYTNLKSIDSNLDILTMAKSFSKRHSITSANYVLVLQDINHEMQLKLIDFGVAKIYAKSQSTIDAILAGDNQSSVLNHPGYISSIPETVSEDKEISSSVTTVVHGGNEEKKESVVDFLRLNANLFEFKDNRRVGKLTYMAPEVYANGIIPRSVVDEIINEDEEVEDVVLVEEIEPQFVLRPSTGGIHRGKMYDPRLADIYSLGICLTLMLTGIRPYDRPSISDVSFNYIMNGNLKKLLVSLKMIRLLTEDALDLLVKILCAADRRIHMRDILRHPFLTDITPPVVNEEETVGDAELVGG